VFADRDGVVAEVLVSAGTQVETKQLLMIVNGGEGGEADQPENGDADEAAGDDE
jgi:pyruvate/2-oxoglutarate dehydrogenase complex dihydrolipoamide acyltransferase (E2) component